tara:strand:- start:2738 stop:3370 length:633 start_codon:yes stop_codon:yes gene_type:complete
MHNNSYSVNVACLVSENFTNSLKEVKSFFTFKLNVIDKEQESAINKKYNAIIIESDLEKNISLEDITIPKIFIQKKNQKRKNKNSFEIIFRFPLNIVQFNQEIIDLCKKYEFNKNSLIKVKDYILDKNERVLRKGKVKLKITEKEINFIDVLHSSKNPLNKNYILKNIWSYSSDADTHTVETHIYRLRQKIKESFGDISFIKNSDDGYSL